MNTEFLPIQIEDVNARSADKIQFDVIFITGDPYYDHPLSGIDLLSRLIVAKGYSVGIIAQHETK